MSGYGPLSHAPTCILAGLRCSCGKAEAETRVLGEARKLAGAEVWNRWPIPEFLIDFIQAVKALRT